MFRIFKCDIREGIKFFFLKINSQNGNISLPLFKFLHLRVIAKKVLRDFWISHPDSEQQLKAWFQEAMKSNWKRPNDIKREYPSASILEDNRVVFNIKGNHYRLIVKINYDYGMVWIRFIGTHAAYDKVNASKI